MNDIGLQEVIEQIKRELLTPNPSAEARGFYPLFAIDKLELEISTRITRAVDGTIKITVFDVIEANASRSSSQEHGHMVRVSLTPLLTSEELASEALKDARTRRTVEQDSRRALLRNDEGLRGEPE